ncbi:hypothetical protein ACMD2_01366 [Ananas comosus]|uniref:Uncharacterized protein n=1 Tax=Ananas comosus TaxID=4615 RepID=A0A199VFZ5_ANACO|nr:hypothetical protein ACMD2_01366 [Ananas comosus]
MAENLFEGLPPPSATPSAAVERSPPPPPSAKRPSPPPQLPPPALKSALKRDKPSESHEEVPEKKKLRFKTTVDATETQIIEAMQKIASHIRNPSKFGKASKLALQLIQAGSVKPGTSDHFFAILEGAMASPSACNEPALRADYHTLFTAVQDVVECFSAQQKNLLTTWTLHAVVANDLYTDDSFVYSKAAGKIKEAISSLPPATVDDDNDEASALALDGNKASDAENKDTSTTETSRSYPKKEIPDPFGLDTLLPSTSKKEKKAREKEVAALNRKADEEESKRFIKSQREALLKCVEIAARRYKVPWAQTVIDILVKHAFDNIDRFTCRQRDAIEKLWASIKEQHIRRKQGKSVTGKLDMNAFEWLQEKYSHEKISIRHAVGGGGERQAEQWLG